MESPKTETELTPYAQISNRLHSYPKVEKIRECPVVNPMPSLCVACMDGFEKQCLKGMPRAQYLGTIMRTEKTRKKRKLRDFVRDTVQDFLIEEKLADLETPKPQKPPQPKQATPKIQPPQLQTVSFEEIEKKAYSETLEKLKQQSPSTSSPLSNYYAKKMVNNEGTTIR